MRRLLALVPIGVFGLAGYAIAFRAIPPGGLAGNLEEVTQSLGSGFTGALVLCFGVVLSWLISRKSDNSARQD